MMGQQGSRQHQLFYTLNLEEHVPRTHLLRAIGYCVGIRSERRLCEEVRLNLAYRCLCRLDLDNPIPDHSTFSKNRHGRFRQRSAFRHVFESVLRRCMHEGLGAGEGIPRGTRLRFVAAPLTRRRFDLDQSLRGGRLHPSRG